MSKQLTVLNISAVLIVAITAIGLMFPAAFGHYADVIYQYIAAHFGWLYMLSVFVFDVFLIGLIFTRYGKLKLGRFDEKPEFSTASWIGMLFSGGLGVGIVFWGVAEPMTHFASPPLPGVEPGSIESARMAMGYTYFHWGLSQWSIFAIAGLIIGLFQYRIKKDSLVSTSMETLFGHNYPTFWRRTVDILAVIATVMGIATSIGMGVLQINGGLTYVYGLPGNPWTHAAILAVITVIFVISASSGLSRGVKWLSNINMAIALGLTLFIMILGPTSVMLKSLVTGIGDYLTHFIDYSLRLDPFRKESNWVEKWTVFYWAWVISWSPFIGAFIARISRGRTIREFVVGVLIVPPLISFLWIAAFGGTAIYQDLYANAGLAQVVANDYTLAMFAFLEQFPLHTFTSTATLVLIATFLITSADSATHILASMSSGGALNPTLRLKIVWGFLLSGIIMALLVAGGLKSLQAGSIVAGLPFTIILILMLFAIIKVLRIEAHLVLPDTLPIKRPAEEAERYHRGEEEVPTHRPSEEFPD
ncbi:BCCT family transporter [Neisseria brasiliensis]|uniref:BCCT family transporter n=1 Tax=Neisseria TaxID=482 RepID=UPI000C278CD1|nr:MULTISPECIES: BCCT family transporter [Neisseria]PJO77358.1 glycine/betaine ABC transporter permease [Neisseria sp. N177_16]QGL25456.1 BCCT family transporter [Neisseria brasiliensis]